MHHSHVSAQIRAQNRKKYLRCRNLNIQLCTAAKIWKYSNSSARRRQSRIASTIASSVQ